MQMNLERHRLNNLSVTRASVDGQPPWWFWLLTLGMAAWVIGSSWWAVLSIARWWR